MMSDKRLGIALISNEAFLRDIKKVLSVPPKTLFAMAEFTNTNIGITIPETDKLLEIWKETGKSSDDLSGVYGVLRHLFNEAVNEKVDINTLIDEIDEFCKEKVISGFEERKEALRTFLTPNPEYLRLRSYSDYLFGVIPSVKSVTGVVQLRAAFADNHSTKIIGYVPLLQIQLKVKHPNEEQDDTFIFQVDEQGLKKLLRYLNEYQSQLLSLKDATSSKLTVYTRPEEDKA